MPGTAAGLTLAHGLPLVTRKYGLFEGCSVTCLDLFLFQECVEDLGLSLVGYCYLLFFNGTIP